MAVFPFGVNSDSLYAGSGNYMSNIFESNIFPSEMQSVFLLDVLLPSVQFVALYKYF